MAQPLPSPNLPAQPCAPFPFMPKSTCLLPLFCIETVNAYHWFQPLVPVPRGMRHQSVQPGTKLKCANLTPHVPNAGQPVELRCSIAKHRFDLNPARARTDSDNLPLLQKKLRISGICKVISAINTPRLTVAPASSYSRQAARLYSLPRMCAQAI